MVRRPGRFLWSTSTGWLKSINYPDNSYDPGQDGANGFSPDAFGMTMEYFDGDYGRGGIGSMGGLGSYLPQHNGNLRAATWGRNNLMIPHDNATQVQLTAYNAAQPDTTARQAIVLKPGFHVPIGQSFHASIDPLGTYMLASGAPNIYAYQYDDNYQLKTAQYGSSSSGSFSGAANAFSEKEIAYDANGNIKTLKRYGENTSTPMHHLTYNYQLSGGNPVNNKLQSVSSYVTTYTYDAIGRMTAVAYAPGANKTDLFIKYDVTGKVLGIYNNANLAEANALFTYQYDDRGFRIRKFEKATGRSTWYVRDASGNVMAIYDQLNTGTPAQVELPLYGSGKLGMAFKYPDHYKYNYEITDHLGNVRAIATRLKFMATATSEVAYEDWEELNFENMDTRHTDAAFNHTPGGQKVIWLNGAQGRHIGPARALRVLPNDTIKMEAFANYLAPAANQNLVSNFAALVAGGFGYANTGETAQAFSAITSALTGAALVPNHSGSVPKAYLKYLIFNKDFQLVHHGEQKITSGAAVQYNAGGQVTSIPHQRLYREVVVTEAMVGSEDYGYMYIYLANESNNNVNVYFDDFTITHLGVDILQTTDYYPFGLVSKHWQKAERHRFGYQGQYAEKDEETGWNHFQLRDYDPIIGRWMATDPYRQYASPYVGMGNNHSGRVDPDGGRDRIDYNSKTDKATITATAGPDRLYVDGVFKGISGADGAWQHQGYDVSEIHISNPSHFIDNVTDYYYDNNDLRVRKILASIPDNPVSQALWRREQSGYYAPITESNYYDYQVRLTDSNSTINLYAEYFNTILGLTGDTGQIGKPGFARSGVMMRMQKLHAAKLNLPKNRWNAFLKANSGKYSGPNWQKNAVRDYNKFWGN